MIGPVLVIIFLLIIACFVIKSGIGGNNQSIKDNKTNRPRLRPKNENNDSTNHSPKIIEVASISNNYNIDKWVRETIEYLDRQPSLSDLLVIKNLQDIGYGDLLSCFEWKFLRLEILWRDGYKCQKCGNKSIYNHVHHTHYIKDQLPWIIRYEYLQTLCRPCHTQIHMEQEIPVYEFKNNNKIRVFNSYSICSRCSGTGYLPQFKHVENGVCFKCGGNSVNKTIFSKILHKHLNNLNEYDDKSMRNRYKDFLVNISHQQFINRYPSVEEYAVNKTSNISHYNSTYDDDLPF